MSQLEYVNCGPVNINTNLNILQIAKTLAAQKMYSKLDNYDDLEGAIIENTVLPSAGQEVEEKAANENNVDKSTSKDEVSMVLCSCSMLIFAIKSLFVVLLP